ncbi:MAG: hypothetical protein WB507_07370 [Solirubrobacterales bacterium]
MKTRTVFRMLAVLALATLMLSSVFVSAQQGDNAVYTTGNILAASSAWIDASAFCGSSGSNTCGGSGTDVCMMIKSALGNLPSNGGVIDARGVVSTTGGAQTCSVNPFATIAQNNVVPINVLLPASTIILLSSWTLPNNTRLVGEGEFTVLEGNTGGGSYSAALIEMGTPPAVGVSCASLPYTPYSGISVEHLKIMGLAAAPAYGGIDNQCAQSSSYVSDVDIVNVKSLGIGIGPGAANSGPYTTLSVTDCGGSSTSACVDLEAQTAGLHGLTCIGNTTTSAPSVPAYPGIIVNAGNNSIEDVHVEAYWDAIEIGDTASAVRNVLVSNVKVAKNGTCGGVANAVHICGPNYDPSLGKCAAFGTGTVTNVNILDVANFTYPWNSVKDDQTGVQGIGTIISSCNMSNCPNPISTAIYTLGGLDGTGLNNDGQYARLASNPASATDHYGSNTTVVATWGVGNNNNSGIPSGTCYTPGAIYSYTPGGTDALYVCTFSGSGLVWMAI